MFSYHVYIRRLPVVSRKMILIYLFQLIASAPTSKRDLEREGWRPILRYLCTSDHSVVARLRPLPLSL